ncbi:serine/threonine-protein kinase [Vannielia litorea]|uniref:serine/threonine-protein kinase n=1 Tax=Vannielia litorea TaxID=1217970 RepID=UPI0021BD58D9|nr:serine/threonine-protein kinase [Vannielia litorea]
MNALSPISSSSAVTGDELPPGTVLGGGQYTIERYLNGGGFGVTYLSRDSLGRPVVIKECFPGAMCCRRGASVRLRTTSNIGAFDQVLDLFKKEARALAALAHPNVVGVHQIFEENGTGYMALDYVDGPDLLDLYEKDPARFTPAELNRILLCLLDALRYVHDSGTLHRDISPDNILMGPDDAPILIDFGSARAGAARTSRILSQVFTVKDGYSPQEFYLTDSPQGRSSDLYALAATMYHLVTGAPPPHSNQRLAHVAEGKPDPYVPLRGNWPGFDGRFLEAIDQCLSVFPKDRMDSAGQWAAFLVAERRTGKPDTRTDEDAGIERRITDLVEETRKAIEEDRRKGVAHKQVRPRTVRAPAPPPRGRDPSYWAILNEDPQELAREAAAWRARETQRRTAQAEGAAMGEAEGVGATENATENGTEAGPEPHKGFSLAGLLGLRRDKGRP